MKLTMTLLDDKIGLEVEEVIDDILISLPILLSPYQTLTFILTLLQIFHSNFLLYFSVLEFPISFSLLVLFRDVGGLLY